MMAIYFTNYRKQSYVFKPQHESTAQANDVVMKAPIIEEVTDGVEFIEIQESNDDMVQITFHFEGGLLSEPIPSNGIGNLSSKLLGKSTKQISRNDYQALFENKGASINSSFNHNALIYGLKTTKEDALLIPHLLKG